MIPAQVRLTHSTRNHSISLLAVPSSAPSINLSFELLTRSNTTIEQQTINKLDSNNNSTSCIELYTTTELIEVK